MAAVAARPQHAVLGPRHLKFVKQDPFTYDHGLDHPATLSLRPMSSAMVVPKPPEPSPDAKYTAVSVRQAAVIGLVGILVSAFFSVVAGVVSASLAARSAVSTTTQQLSGETDRSRAEFLRDKQLNVYATAISHEEGWPESLWTYHAVTTRMSQEKITHEFLNPNQTIRQSTSALDADEASMRLLASDQTLSAFHDLQTAKSNAYSALYRIIEERAAGRGDKQNLDAASKDFRDRYQVAVDAESEFYQATRRDMGNR